MSHQPVALKENDNIKEAATIFLKHSFDGAPVVNKIGEIAGIFTKTHLYRAILNNLPGDTPVSRLMKKDVITIDDSCSTEKAWQMAWTYGVGRLPVVDKNGRLQAMMTRTDLVQAFEQKHKDTINKLNAILNSAHNGICAIDKYGTIITFNLAAERITGIKVIEAVNNPLVEFFPNNELITVLTTGQPLYNRRMKLGGKSVIVNITPVISREHTVGAVAVFQDISELENISKELAVTVELCDNLDDIINSSYDGIAVLDNKGKLVKQNESYKRLFNSLTSDELSDATKTISSVGKKAIATKAPSSLMYKLQGGKELFITGNPVYNKESNPTRVVINLRDISEVNDLKRQLEASKELTKRYYSELKTLRAKQLDSNIVVGHSPAIKSIFDQVARIAKVDSTVLILGESGVGKEVIAKLIHKESTRANGPFIHINCGAIPENLLESELFGYEAGAFTGAKREGKPGMFELAHTGTLLLDEVADLPLAMQVKLLSVIQNREVTRIGGTKPIKADIRLLAATNQSLSTLVGEGKFRADLYYRLNVIPLRIPALRERKEDIPSFIAHFLDKYNKKYKMSKVLDPKVIEYMIDYGWPGNVRELENLIERVVVVNKGNYVTINELSLILPADSFHTNIHLNSKSENEEKHIIAKLYQQYNSTRKVGALLGIHQSTVVRKMKKYGIKATRRTGTR